MSNLKRIISTCALACGLTYLSLLAPGRAPVMCGNVPERHECQVLAYGFPLSFVADSRSTSPIGSVARDPLSLMVGQDDVLWRRLGASVLFWLLAVTICKLAWRRWQAKRHGD